MRKRDAKFPFEMYAESGSGRLINVRIHENNMEIVELISGTVTVLLGTEIFEASAGDIIYVPQGVVFRVDAKNGTAALRGMIFSGSIIEDNMENFDSEIFYMFYLQSRSKIAHFKKDSPVHASVARCMAYSYDEYVSKEVCYMLPIRANIYLAMTAILRYYCGKRNEDENAVFHNVLRLRPVMNYISEHYCEKIYIEKLAGMINVSPDYFTKMFKESIGKTPIEYINSMRINRSISLLTNTELSMTEIAEATGFSGPNYFHKIFKQYMKTSPLVFRKSTK